MTLEKSKEMKDIKVTRRNWRLLKLIKMDKNLRNMDEVLDEILRHYPDNEE